MTIIRETTRLYRVEDVCSVPSGPRSVGHIEEGQVIGRIYTLKDAQKATGEARSLITYLIVDRKIPTQDAGMAKVLDEAGLALLRSAIEDYRRKSGPVRPRPRKSRGRRREPAPAM